MAVKCPRLLYQSQCESSGFLVLAGPEVWGRGRCLSPCSSIPVEAFSCLHLRSCACKFCWRHVCQRTVRALFVVISPPSFDFAPCVVQTGEPVGIQTFIAQSAVEALHEGILHRLARLNELQSHAPFFAPGGQRPAAKLRPIVQTTIASGRPLSQGIRRRTATVKPSIFTAN